LRVRLGLTAEDTEQIKADVLKPILARAKKLSEYEELLKEMLEERNPPSTQELKDLRDFQKDHLGLRDEDVTDIDNRCGLIAVSISPLVSADRASVSVNNPELLMRQANSNTVRQRLKIAEKQLLSIDCGSGVMLELVRVPAGKFMMGSDESDSEKPIHEVQLKEFLIGKYVVTNAQWQAVMKAKGSAKLVKKFQGDLQPVVGESWLELREFCRKLSELGGREVRLPNEAEWEYAARGGNQSRGLKYAGSNNIDEVAWYGENSESSTHSVGKKKANELGIYDMSGNVWEWCLDEWHDSYKDKPEQLRRSGNEAWGDLNIDDNDNRSCPLRGGSWCGNARGCRSAYRIFRSARITLNLFGFRVVCVVR